MNKRSIAMAVAMAATIALTSLVPAGPAQAQPLGAFKEARIGTGAEAVVEAGRRRPLRPLRPHRPHRRHHGGAAAAIVGLGAFALGAAIASQARQCHYQRVKVWDPALGAYVIHRQRVC